MLSVVKKYGFLILLSGLIITRFFHFSDQIDGPHVWRQSETAQYIQTYFEEGIDILKPSVCWMGGHKTLLLEFPLPEVMVALLQKIFGDGLWVARSFFLLFFCLSLFYFYKVLKLIFNNKVPEIATILYCATPLSLFYSRAIHIDFFAVAFAHGMLFYFIKALHEKKWSYWILASTFATIAFLTKSPYAFYFAFPIVVFAIRQKAFLYLLKNSWLILFPIIALFLWNDYSKSINELAPDWYFIPNYNKFTDMWYWYFGTGLQRLELHNWTIVLNRLFNEILGYFGLLISLVGVVTIKAKNSTHNFAISWLIGSIAYWLIFFNLNLIHNYYQIPFIGATCLLMAVGINYILEKLKNKKAEILIACGIIALIITESFIYAEQNYYSIHDDFTDIATVIEENTAKNDLVVVSHGGLSPQCPIILYQSNRYGWSIPIHDINPQLYFQLYEQGGATAMALVYSTELKGEMRQFFDYFENKKIVKLDQHNLNVYIAKLDFKEANN